MYLKAFFEVYKILGKLGIKPKDVIGMGGDVVKMGKSLFNTRVNPKLLQYIEKNQKIPSKIIENLKIHARTLKNTSENQVKLFEANLKDLLKAKSVKIPVKSKPPVTGVQRPVTSGKELPEWTKGWTPRVIKGGKDGLATGGRAAYYQGEGPVMEETEGMDFLSSLTQEQVDQDPERYAQLLIGLRKPDSVTGEHGDETAWYIQPDGSHISVPWGWSYTGGGDDYFQLIDFATGGIANHFRTR